MSRSDWRRPTDFAAPEGRRRVAVTLSYDGRRFCGWQSQNGLPSVQDTVLNACRKLLSEDDISVCGSGRTDSGVHAYGQVAHIEFPDSCIPVRAFCNGLNSFLPPEVRVRNAWDVPRSFHARFSAMAREYRYFIREGSPSCFSCGLVTSVREFPDLEVIKSYAEHIVGTHDFSTFAASGDMSPSKVRDIYESDFSECLSMYGERLFCYRICGNAFLYHMVRSIVGSMLQWASEGVDERDFVSRLEGADRRLAGKTAPSDGLYLWRVSYDCNEYLWFEEKYGR